MLWRWNGNPYRTDACRLRRDRDHCMADLYACPCHDRERVARPPGLTSHSERYTGVRVEALQGAANKKEADLNHDQPLMVSLAIRYYDVFRQHVIPASIIAISFRQPFIAESFPTCVY